MIYVGESVKLVDGLITPKRNYIINFVPCTLIMLGKCLHCLLSLIIHNILSLTSYKLKLNEIISHLYRSCLCKGTVQLVATKALIKGKCQNVYQLTMYSAKMLQHSKDMYSFSYTSWLNMGAAVKRNVTLP